MLAKIQNNLENKNINYSNKLKTQKYLWNLYRKEENNDNNTYS